MCQLSSRCCTSDANGTIANCPIEPPAVTTPSATERFLGGVCRLMAPKLGPNPAATMPIPQITLPSVKTKPAVAGSGGTDQRPEAICASISSSLGDLGVKN